MAVQNAIVLEAEQMNGALEKKVDEQMEIIHLGHLVNAQVSLDASVISAQQHTKLVKKITWSQTNTLDPKAVMDKYLTIKYLISSRLVPFLPMDYRKLGSSKGIRDAFNKLVLAIYLQMKSGKLSEGVRDYHQCYHTLFIAVF